MMAVRWLPAARASMVVCKHSCRYSGRRGGVWKVKIFDFLDQLGECTIRKSFNSVYLVAFCRICAYLAVFGGFGRIIG